MQLPGSPRLFLVDGYALIYRAFFALIARPLTTSRGENTSAAWGIVNFLQRLRSRHQPDYLGWVHDSGLSFRHEQYPAYKATREKLTDELQADFDRGMDRICELLDAYRIPILSLDGYEADDVIGTLAVQGVAQGASVVIVSGDKDFQQLVQPGVWLLNPGRGGPGGVDEQWVGEENGSERLGVAPRFVTDYLSLVGDSSDNVPGVPGIGDKTARELVETYGSLDEIISNAASIRKKRPREALLAHSERARLSKQLVTIRDNLPVVLELTRLRVDEPDQQRLKELFVELEFHGLARDAATETRDDTPASTVRYVTVDGVAMLRDVVARVREVGHMVLDTETLSEPDSPLKGDPLRSSLVAVSIAVARGEAYYFPLRHRARQPAQRDFIMDSSGDRSPTGTAEDRGLAQGGDDAEVVPSTGRRKRTARNAASIALGMMVEGTGARVVNLPPLDSAEMMPLRLLLEDSAVRKITPNAKHDMLVLRRIGIDLAGLEFDTMLASYVLDPGRRSHALDVLALEFLDHRMTSYEDLCGKGQNAIPFDECSVEAARNFSCERADMTLRLKQLFQPKLAAYELQRLLDTVEIPLIPVLAEMEWTGIAIDTAWFSVLKERFAGERRDVEQEIFRLAGTEFNINSNLQLREILFDRLQLPVLKRTATGPSTDATVLLQLAEDGHELPSRLMEYRELAKLENTYLDSLPTLLHPATKRLHTSFNQTVATTGRLSSSDPNLQNIPIRRELGRDIRRGFIPRLGWWLLAADYSQIELRLLAHLSHDVAFLAAFRTGDDIHRQTASVIFDVAVEEVTGEMRSRAKTINFATIYGQGANALARQLHVSREEARTFIERYFERFDGVRRYLDSMVAFAHEHGYVQTIFGRRRYIPELRERNFNIRAFGERTATNSPIQGSAADLIKIAMIRIHEIIRNHALASRMLLQVHDELVFEVPEEELEQMQQLVGTEMEGAASLSVPLVVDIGKGRNWLETKGM